MNLRKNSRQLLAFTLFGAAAISCDNTDSGTGDGLVAVGVITLAAQKTATGYITLPTANFYKVAGANFLDASDPTDECAFYSFDPASTASSVSANGAPALAGGPIATTVSGHTDSLKVTSLMDFTYRLFHSPGIIYTPGDSVKFVITGNGGGYPAYTVTARTAEPFTSAPLDLSQAASGIPITWSVPSDTNSEMVIGLRYAPLNSNAVTTQISCSVRDDGLFVLPSTMSAAFAGGTQQSVTLQRIRTLIAAPSGQNYINFVSIFAFPTPGSP